MARKPVRDWLFVTEAASMLGVSRMHVHNLIHAGFFPNVNTTNGSYLLYLPDVLKVKEARDAGLFVVGRPPSGRPLLTYAEMIRKLRDRERSGSYPDIKASCPPAATDEQLRLKM